jgi:hypothetical protein
LLNCQKKILPVSSGNGKLQCPHVTRKLNNYPALLILHRK